MSGIVSAIPEAEFVDLAGLKSGWGINRTLGYELPRDGRIRSVNLRREGRIRGKRLIEVQSVREFLASCSDNIDPQLSEQLRRTRAIGVERERKRKSKPAALTRGGGH
jgi:hypothetical protein